jgi:PEGA domain.
MKSLTFVGIVLLAVFIASGVPVYADEIIGGGQGYFEITSSPSYGSVYFDGSYRGTTPVTVTVATEGTPSHQIRVTKDGYQDWEQTYNGNPFQGETIHINADLIFIPITIPTTPPVGSGKGYYSISSSPSGASVYFDGSYKGLSPVTVTVPTTGTPGHTISLSLSGYQTWSQTYSGNPGEGQTVYVNAYLTPVQSYGSVSVTSSPSGATATLDGGNSQSTPCTFNNVVAGSHTVQVNMPGYQTWTGTTTVYNSQNSQVYASLTPHSPGTGSIYAVSTPQGAGVYVDSRYYGPAPQIAAGLSPGYHQVRLSLSGFQDWNGNIYVESGKTTTVTQQLSVSPTQYPTSAPGTGTITVNSNPSGAGVYVDNGYIGITPLTVPSVQPGSHVVMVSQTGYASWQATVQVQSGQVTPVDATLSLQPTTAPTKSAPEVPLILLSISAFVLFLRRKED